MSFTGMRGLRGQDGADGSALQPNGGVGMQGGDAALISNALIHRPRTKQVAKGGRGGSGGDGATSDTTTGGQGGDGGHGGAADSSIVASAAPTLTALEVTASAVGGSGGNGGSPGAGATGASHASGGNGGDGGQATAAASVNATTPPDPQVAVTVSVQGGNGGSAGFGAKGGDGASELLYNAATAVTSNGTIAIAQNAIGGNGGDARTQGSGGDGGDATSSLSLDDTLNPPPLQAVAIKDSFYAFGGSGGAGSAHQGRAGDATSIVDLTGSATDSDTVVLTEVHGGTAGAELTRENGAALAGGMATSEVTLHGAIVDAGSQAFGGKGGDAVGPDATGGAGGAAEAFAHAYGISSATALLVVKPGDGGNGTQGAAGGAGGDAVLDEDALIVAARPGGYLNATEDAFSGNGGSSDTGRGGAGGAATISFAKTASSSFGLNISATGGNGGDGGAGAGRGGDAAATATGIGLGNVYVNSRAVAGQSSGTGGNASANAVSGGASTMTYANSYGGDGLTSGSADSTAATSATVKGILSASATGFVAAGVLQRIGSSATGTLTGSDSASAATQYGAATPIAATGAILAQAVGLPSDAESAPILAANPTIAASLGEDPTIFMLGNLGSGHGAMAVGAEETSSVITASLYSFGNADLGLYGGIASAQGLQEVKLIIKSGFKTVFHADFTSGDIGAQAVALFTDNEIDLGSLTVNDSPNLSIELDVTSQAGGTFEGGIIVGAAPPAMSTPMPGRFASAGDLISGLGDAHPSLAMHSF